VRTSQKAVRAQFVVVMTEASLAQDATQGPSCANRETHQRPLHPRSWHVPRIVGLLGAGCRPIGRLCALHYASLAKGARQGPGAAESNGADCGPSHQRSG
jgi:hypothetical protein